MAVLGYLSIQANISFGAFRCICRSAKSLPPRLALSSLRFSDHGDTEKLSRATACISSLGVALGYATGSLLLLATVLPMQHAGDSTSAL